MNIIIPTDDNNDTTGVCVSFGRAPYFMLYDGDRNSASFLDNTAAASTGGAGIKAAQIVVDNGADVLLTPRCGENAAEVLRQAGVQIYKTQDGTALDNIEAFSNGKLAALTDVHPGFHGHGGA